MGEIHFGVIQTAVPMPLLGCVSRQFTHSFKNIYWVAALCQTLCQVLGIKYRTRWRNWPHEVECPHGRREMHSSDFTLATLVFFAYPLNSAVPYGYFSSRSTISLESFIPSRHPRYYLLSDPFPSLCPLWIALRSHTLREPIVSSSGSIRPI